MWIAAAILAAVVTAVFIDNFLTRRSNHHRNTTEEEQRPVPRLISDQNTLRAYRFGKWTLDRNGCCAVAVYNALCLLEPGTPHRLSAVIRSLDTYLGYNAWGLLGGSPPAVGRYFRKRGFRVRFMTCVPRCDHAAVDACIRTSQVCIALFRHPGSLSMHYAAVRWNTETGCFDRYNYNGHEVSFDRYLNASGKHLIGIWCIGEPRADVDRT